MGPSSPLLIGSTLCGCMDGMMSPFIVADETGYDTDTPIEIEACLHPDLTDRCDVETPLPSIRIDRRPQRGTPSTRRCTLARALSIDRQRPSGRGREGCCSVSSRKLPPHANYPEVSATCDASDAPNATTTAAGRGSIDRIRLIGPCGSCLCRRAGRVRPAWVDLVG